jgi:exportin-5
VRISKLTAFIEPVKNEWKNESLKQALGSYNGFCELLGLDKVQRYLIQRRVHEIADWGSAELDAEGLALQAELEQRQLVSRLIPACGRGVFSHKFRPCPSG